MEHEGTLVELTTVGSAMEGQMLVDVLMSGGIAAMLRGGEISGYGLTMANPGGGAGTVLVKESDLPEAQEFLRKWRVPLLEEHQGADPEGSADS